jgi:2-hydroxychromene-2-carboxylate isomerase
MDGTLVVRNRDFKETQAMSKTVEFLFDVGSPYSYLAYHALPTIARNKGASIVWTPVLLGGIFHATGNHSPVEVPAKGQHLTVDLLRWAKHYGVNYTPNPSFPINTLALMRGAVAMQMRGEEEFQRYLASVFSAMFEVPRNLNQPSDVADMLTSVGFDPAEVMALVSTPAVKEKLKANTEQAVARGVFGAPTFFVGTEMFWGQDRLLFVDAALGM